MSDLIRREDAIKALGECPLNWTDTAEEIQAVHDWECHKAAIEAVPSATDEEFEWCHDCKEYDQEKHCCHRWTKVIRQTVEELKADRPKGEWIPCEERLPSKDGKYLIVGRQGAVNILPYHDGMWYGRWGVIAWMPLPKPYREREGK